MKLIDNEDMLWTDQFGCLPIVIGFSILKRSAGIHVIDYRSSLPYRRRYVHSLRPSATIVVSLAHIAAGFRDGAFGGAE